MGREGKNAVPVIDGDILEKWDRGECLFGPCPLAFLLSPIRVSFRNLVSQVSQRPTATVTDPRLYLSFPSFAFT